MSPERARACLDALARLPASASWHERAESTSASAALAGASLPAGTFVLLLFKAAAVDAGAWGVDAADFRPERWLARADADTTTPRPPSWPYSAGPRSCPGTLLAQSVTATALAGVWARLELRASARPLREAATLTAHPADGHCTLTARVRGAGGTA
jgi:cytochrome P450